MPDFETSVSIEIDDFVYECTQKEKKELLSTLVYECSSDEKLRDHLKSLIVEEFVEEELKIPENLSLDHSVFIDSLKALEGSYYQLPNEVISKINSIAKPYRLV